MMPESKFITAISVTDNATIDGGLYFSGAGAKPTKTGVTSRIKYSFDLTDAMCDIERLKFHVCVKDLYTDYDTAMYLKYFDRRFDLLGETFFAGKGDAYSKELTEVSDEIMLSENITWTGIAWTQSAMDVHCYIEFSDISAAKLEVFPAAPCAVCTPPASAANPFVSNRLSWELKYSNNYTESQASAALEWKTGTDGTVTVVNISGGNKYYDVPADTFSYNSVIYYRVKAVSIYGKETDYSQWASFSTYTAPIIYSVEPDGINQNRGLNIAASFSAVNYTSFSLAVVQNGITLDTYTGTTQAQVIIPADTIPSGDTVLKLTAYYNCETYQTQAQGEAEFLAYGNPAPPVQDSTTVYNSATPVFTWTNGTNASDLPTAWELSVFKGETPVEETGITAGTAASYTVTNALENHESYCVKIRVKNQFNLWSDWSVKNIEIEYTDLPKPEFEILTSGNAAILNITNSDNVMFASCEVWRKDGVTEWKRVALDLGRISVFTDYTLAGGVSYTYKIRAKAYDGAISESVSKGVAIKMYGFEFTNVENHEMYWKTKFDYNQNNVSVGSTLKRNIDATVYSGNVGATIETDGLSYQEMDFEFDMSYAEFEAFKVLISKSKVLLYRDERGHKCYGSVTSDIKESHIPFNGYKISFKFTEVNFLEEDIYYGGRGAVLVYLDGQYRLNGAVLLTGEVIT